MSDTNDCAREVTWSGGTHTFNLGHPWVQNVLSVRGLNGTPAACLKRLEEGVFAADDVERVLELGLIGGGLSRAEADSLIDQHVCGKPLAANAVIAFQVLAALFVGREQGNADASA